MARILWAALAAAIALWAVAEVRAAPATLARRQQGDVVSFCRVHGTLDFPGPLFLGAGHKPGDVPTQLEKLFDTAMQWRCMDGVVWVCADSADGDLCSKKDPSRTPSSGIVQDCRDAPEQDYINFADGHYSAFDWRCKGGRPVIVKGYPLDRNRFFKASWVPLALKDGVPAPTKLPDELR
jgi:hypothetical protein